MGNSRWLVTYRVARRTYRRFFTSKKTAEVFAASIQPGVGWRGAEAISTLSPRDRADLEAFVLQARESGRPLREILDQGRRDVPDSPTISEAMEELLTVKAKAGRSHRYCQALRWTLRAFVHGLDAVKIATLSHREVEAHLDGMAPASRSTVRSRLSTLFRFAVRRGWISANPCERLEPTRTPARHPSVLQPKDMATALAWLRTHRPRVLGWFVLSALCGLRPEEAERTDWEAVDLTAGLVKVEAQTSKIRQRRVVYPLPSAISWLHEARRLGASLPLPSITRRRAIRELRGVLGWSSWPKDVTRHSCASYWLAETGDAARVADQLGHDVRTLLKHYRALVTKAEADEFWGIMPSPPDLVNS